MKVTMLVAALCLLGTAANAQFAFDDGSPFDPNQQRIFEQQRQDLYNMQQQQRQFQLDAQQQQQDQYNRLQEQRPVRCFNSFGQLVCQ
jgi:outer membrane biogenesis lipoprotein LolB